MLLLLLVFSSLSPFASFDHCHRSHSHRTHTVFGVFFFHLFLLFSFSFFVIHLIRLFVYLSPDPKMFISTNEISYRNDNDSERERKKTAKTTYWIEAAALSTRPYAIVADKLNEQMDGGRVCMCGSVAVRCSKMDMNVKRNSVEAFSLSK